MRIDLSRLLIGTAVLAFLGGTVVTVLAGDDDGKQPAAAVSPTPDAQGGVVLVDPNPNPPNGCLGDAAVVEDIRKRREELDARQKELAAKEAELKDREQAIADELKKLEQARDDIAKIDAARRKESDEKVAKIVETLQSMSPKAGAQLLSQLDESLAVAAISQMDTARLAKVMNVMDAAHSSRLTELLAGVVRARHESATATKDAAPAAKGAAVATADTGTDPDPASQKKGGEK